MKNQIDANGLWLDSHRLWWNILERYKSKKVMSSVTLIYFVAEQQYLNLIPVLLRVSIAIISICGNYGSALQVSSYHGSQEIVQMLLDKGANVNAQSRCNNGVTVGVERDHRALRVTQGRVSNGDCTEA